MIIIIVREYNYFNQIVIIYTMQQDKKYYVLCVLDLQQLLRSSNKRAYQLLDTYPLYENYTYDAYTDRVLDVDNSFHPSYTSLRKHAILKGTDIYCRVIISEPQNNILKNLISEEPNIDIERRRAIIKQKSNRECECIIL